MALPIQDLSAVCCASCGLYDASLRYSTHPTIVSTVVTANQSAPGGILCSKCRAIAASKALAISMVAGWWSVRGPRLTLDAIRANLRGGDQPAATNAPMLRAIAVREYQNENPYMAATFARAAHAVQPQRENSRLIDELSRAGHRDAPPSSRWQFAPAVTLAVLSLVIAAAAFEFLTREKQVAPVPAAQASVIPPIRAWTPSTPRVSPASYVPPTADELEKKLTADSEDGLAGQYLRTRLGELRRDIPARVRSGESLMTTENVIRGLRDQPAVSRFIESRAELKTAYASLINVMTASVQYYHGGAPVEAVQRTAGEALDVTVDVALDAIDADSRGHTAESSALGQQTQENIDGLVQMKRDLRIRGAVIGLTAQAIDACVKAAGH